MHIFHVFKEKYHLVGDSILRGDDVGSRTTHTSSGYVYVEHIVLTIAMHVSYCGWAEINFL